eukprot:COSAG02_NODE_66_length_42609_cov_95.996848_21_plen_501_part_00
MRSRSPSPSADGSARLVRLAPLTTAVAPGSKPVAANARARMACVVVAGLACSTGSVITDEIVDLYAMEQLRLPAASWGRIASAGSATVSIGLLVVALVVDKTGTRMLGAASLAVLGTLVLLLCTVRLEVFVVVLGLSLVCRDAAYVCTNSLCQTVHASAATTADSKDDFVHWANMWYRIATGSAAVLTPVIITQATAALADSGNTGRGYALVIGATGVGMSLAGAFLWTYPPAVGTEPAPPPKATTSAPSSFAGAFAECWESFAAPFTHRPGLLRFVAITTVYESFSFMGAMQFGVYRLVTDLGVTQTSFGWLCSASAVCGLAAIALVAKLSTTAGVQPTLCGIYGCQSVMLLAIGATNSPELSVAAFFVWRCLDRARWAPYSVWTSLLTGGGANDKTAMFAMQKVMRAAPSALLNIGVLAPIAQHFGLQILFMLCGVCGKLAYAVPSRTSLFWCMSFGLELQPVRKLRGESVLTRLVLAYNRSRWCDHMATFPAKSRVT